MIDPQVIIRLGNEIDEFRKENALLKERIRALEEVLDRIELRLRELPRCEPTFQGVVYDPVQIVREERKEFKVSDNQKTPSLAEDCRALKGFISPLDPSDTICDALDRIIKAARKWEATELLLPSTGR